MRTVRVDLEGERGTESTAVEITNNLNQGAIFTEVLSESAAVAGSGNAVTGEYTLGELGEGSADFDDVGSIPGQTFSVTEASSSSFDRSTVGNAVSGGYTLSESSTTDYSFTHAVGGGGEAFTLSGNGQDAADSEKLGNGVTGDYTQETTGSDSYTLVESGSTGSGSFTATVSGVDGYITSEQGNATRQIHERTTTGGGTYDRVVSGSGTTLSSASGTNSYALTEAGDERAGHFEQAKFGENRYDLLPLFADVSNAVDGANPGHVTFYTHGLPFRDPNALTRWLGRRGDDLRDAGNWVGDKLGDLDEWLWDPNNPLGTVLMVAGLFNPLTAPLVISYGVAKFGGIGFDRWGLDKQVAANNGWESPTLVGTLADVYGEAGAAFGEGLGDGGVIVVNNLGKTFSLGFWSPWEEKKQGIIKEYGVIGEWADLSAMIGSEALFAAATLGAGNALTAGKWALRLRIGASLQFSGGVTHGYGIWSQQYNSNPLALNKDAAAWVRAVGSNVKAVGLGITLTPLFSAAAGFSPLSGTTLGAGMLYMAGDTVVKLATNWDQLSWAQRLEIGGPLISGYGGYRFGGKPMVSPSVVQGFQARQWVNGIGNKVWVGRNIAVPTWAAADALTVAAVNRLAALPGGVLRGFLETGKDLANPRKTTLFSGLPLLRRGAGLWLREQLAAFGEDFTGAYHTWSTAPPTAASAADRFVCGPARTGQKSLPAQTQRVLDWLAHPPESVLAARAAAALVDWHENVYGKMNRSQKSKVTTIVAGYDIVTGDIVVRPNSKQKPTEIAITLPKDWTKDWTNCAETHVINQLLLNGSCVDNIRLLQPMSPDRRTGGLIPKEFCDHCISRFWDILGLSGHFDTYPAPMQNGRGFCPDGLEPVPQDPTCTRPKNRN